MSRLVLSILPAILAVLASELGAGESEHVSRRVALSYLMPSESRQGYGTLGIDRSVMGKPLQIGERKFPTGLGTHANSRIVYALEGPCDRFETWVGVDAEMKDY